MIEGAAKGIDTIAKEYAQENDWKIEEYPAEWSIGKQAGILRNIKMYENTDEVLKFLLFGMKILILKI